MNKRWVIKIGSALLTNDGKGLDKIAIASWVSQISELLWTLTPTKALHTPGNRPTRDQNYINVLAFSALKASCNNSIASSALMPPAL
jgi:hypothetical protein